ncbi:hypothetical protein [Mesorhizobium sp. WSM3868]|uniref:hypothetical protein n=1 Tax=Mesorhizobium sp. WSM3868 TaxID=2029405 RepID=UPI00117F6AAA|nr:hypothetical protein [Mesorhizobium sp. WSM3868]
MNSSGKVDASVVGSVIFGGRFDVSDDHQHPFLRYEKAWGEQCLKQNVPLLGISLGAHIMATVLALEGRREMLVRGMFARAGAKALVAFPEGCRFSAAGRAVVMVR